VSAPENLPLVRIQLRYPDEATFIERYAPNITRGGIFLASRNPLAAGTTLRFEVCLMHGVTILAGTGKVTWVREFDPVEPQRAHGMGVQFITLDPGSRLILERLLERKAAAAKPTAPAPVIVPAPARTGSGSAAGADPESALFLTDEALQRAIARARVLASRTEDVESLRAREPEEPVTLEKAMQELPRFLGARR
jgi:molecular chaperone DnaK